MNLDHLFGIEFLQELIEIGLGVVHADLELFDQSFSDESPGYGLLQQLDDAQTDFVYHQDASSVQMDDDAIFPDGAMPDTGGQSEGFSGNFRSWRHECIS